MLRRGLGEASGHRLIVAAIALALLFGACGGSQPLASAPTGLAGTGAPGASAGGGSNFTLDYPAQGAIVTVNPVPVGGRAPAGARIVQDIAFAPDESAIAGPDGRWEIRAKVKEGANELVFRLGDDETTAVRLGITYSPVPTAGPTQAPIATPDAGPTEPPDPTIAPEPTPSFRTFEDGTWIVGSEIKPGTYRLRESTGWCYWARLRGFSGELGDIIANDNVFDGFAVVTIKKTDEGFESTDCGEWSSDLSRVTDSKTVLDLDGTFIVGTDLSPGRWRSTRNDWCYWARLSGFGGQLRDIIANDNVFDAAAIVTIRSTDKGFLTKDCGTWTRL